MPTDHAKLAMCESALEQCGRVVGQQTERLKCAEDEIERLRGENDRLREEKTRAIQEGHYVLPLEQNAQLHAVRAERDRYREAPGTRDACRVVENLLGIIRRVQESDPFDEWGGYIEDAEASLARYRQAEEMPRPTDGAAEA